MKELKKRISFIADDASLQLVNEYGEAICSFNVKDCTGFLRARACYTPESRNEADKASFKGLQFLLDNQERFNLNCKYDNNAEMIYIQLSDNQTGQETVFNGADIFRQVYEWMAKND